MQPALLHRPNALPCVPPYPRVAALARFAGDPRHFQIAALATLLVVGIVVLDFDLGVLDVGLTLGGCLATQAVATRIAGLAAFEPRSALISGLSLCLLLRVDAPGWLLVAAALAIGSKFVLRVAGRHVVNPTAFAIALLVIGTDHAWVSPAQWGQTAISALAMAGIGLIVLTRAQRLDIVLAFVSAWAAIVVGRALLLGDSLSIAAHQLAAGSLVLFAFFMITDPRTTPRARPARIVFALAVALLAAALTFLAHRGDGLVLALALAAPLTPALDRCLPGAPHHWRKAPAATAPPTIGRTR